MWLAIQVVLSAGRSAVPAAFIPSAATIGRATCLRNVAERSSRSMTAVRPPLCTCSERTEPTSTVTYSAPEAVMNPSSRVAGAPTRSYPNSGDAEFNGL